MKKPFLYQRFFRLPIANCQLLLALFLVPFALCLFSFSSHAQNDSLKKHKIAVFAPLYLDSAFDARQEYRYAKNTLPRFINPGLEFYQGVQLALDSLSEEGTELEVFVLDTRSAKETLEQQLNKPELRDIELIIAHCSNNELRLLSGIALARKIPFINTTIPNDAGITANPYFVILNPTLKTQCEGIYKFVQKYYALDPVVIFRRRAAADDLIKTIFDEYGKNTLSVPLKVKYVTLNDSFSVNQLIPHLDSTHATLCISGSLDVNFGKRLAFQLASLGKQYKSTVIGMPTWDAIKDFSKPDFKGTEIIYSNPFYNPRADKISAGITEYFNTQLYARPSDMVFRGYEVTWLFSRLLTKYGKDVASNLGNKQYHSFTAYDIQPVINKTTMTLDYFENKKLYFLKWLDGTFKVISE